MQLAEFTAHSVQCRKANHEMLAHRAVVKCIGRTGEFYFAVQRLV